MKPKKVNDAIQQAVNADVSRPEWLSALGKVRAAVDTKGSTGIEQAQHFIIDDDHVVAYNDRIAVSAPLKVKTGLHITVNAADLYKVLTDIQEDSVVVRVAEDGTLSVTSQTTQAGLSCGNLEGEFADLINGLALSSLEDDAWADLPENFLDAVNLCSFSVSRDIANLAFNSVRILPDRILSTDNWRISRYAFAKGKAKLDCLIPYAAIRELIKYGLVKAQQPEGSSWVHFRDVDGLVFSSRTIEAEFPECDKFLALEGEDITMPAGLSDALRSILVFTPGDDDNLKEAEIRFAKGKVVVRAQNDRGWIERSVYMAGLKKLEATPMLKINPVFFADILKRATTMVVAENRTLFKAGAFEHVITN